MTKKYCMISTSLLLVWFFFDMFGVSVGNVTLVEGAWQEIDGLWYVLFILLFLLFYFKERYGKYLLTVFLFFWVVMQFLSH